MTVIEVLYCCNNMGEMMGWEDWKNKGGWMGQSLYLQNHVMDNDHNFIKEIRKKFKSVKRISKH